MPPLLVAVERFLRIEAVGGAVLLVAAAIALLCANSPAAHGYLAFWETPLLLGFGAHCVSLPLHFWVNDVLMTVFFLVAGMEIRREMHSGTLESFRLALLPLLAALGGVAIPALIYLAVNPQLPNRTGWAVPTATDIAFAVGILALLGSSIPAAVRVLLLSLAIIDDIVAVIIIALFYSAGVDYSSLLVVATGALIVVGMQYIRIESASAYIVPGAVIWLGLLLSGIHPTLTGVLLGLMTPVRADPRDAQGVLAPAVRIPTALHPWVAFAVMPAFALANAGVSFRSLDLVSGSGSRVCLGVFLALWCGKPAGILASSWIAVQLGWCQMPPQLTWRGMLLVACLGGVGFTMSVFIATLAFTDETLLTAAKAGVLLASTAAGVTGLILGGLYVWRRRLVDGPLEPA